MDTLVHALVNANVNNMNIPEAIADTIKSVKYEPVMTSFRCSDWFHSESIFINENVEIVIIAILISFFFIVCFLFEFLNSMS